MVAVHTCPSGNTPAQNVTELVRCPQLQLQFCACVLRVSVVKSSVVSIAGVNIAVSTMQLGKEGVAKRHYWER
jgi:hypothetical protein